MSASCEPLLEALKDCLLHSDCVLKKGLLPSQCLKEHTDELPEKCKSLRQASFECKRGLVRHPIPVWNKHRTVVLAGYEKEVSREPSCYHGTNYMACLRCITNAIAGEAHERAEIFIVRPVISS